MLPSKCKLQCKVCGRIVTDHCEMRHHISSTHNDQQTLVPKRLKDKYVKDKMMGNSSRSLADFEVSALSIAVRLCPTCNQYIPEKVVERHMKKHENGCEVYCCSKRFRSAEKLRVHQQSCSNVSHKAICEICGKMTQGVESVKKHIYHVHVSRPKKPQIFTCEVCGKEIATLKNFNRHMMIHVSVKPHQCSECGMGFSQKTNLKTHMRVHSGDKPYKCDMCTEAYAHKVSLKTHKKKKHGIDMWADQSKETPV